MCCLPGNCQRYTGLEWHNDKDLSYTLYIFQRWQPKGICVYVLHPGNMVSSSLARNWWFYRLIFAIVRPFTKSLVSSTMQHTPAEAIYVTKFQAQAAATTIYCATASELTGFTGQYYNNCYFCQPSQAALNEEMATSLWETSERMVRQILDEKP